VAALELHVDLLEGVDRLFLSEMRPLYAATTHRPTITTSTSRTHIFDSSFERVGAQHVAPLQNHYELGAGVSRWPGAASPPAPGPPSRAVPAVIASTCSSTAARHGNAAPRGGSGGFLARVARQPGGEGVPAAGGIPSAPLRGRRSASAGRAEHLGASAAPGRRPSGRACPCDRGEVAPSIWRSLIASSWRKWRYE